MRALPDRLESASPVPANTGLPSSRWGRPHVARRGWSLVEVIVVLTMMAILISIGIPVYDRALEQSKADIAAANLRAIWTAERLYWLDNHAYAANLSDLTALGLLDPTVTASTGVYLYRVPSASPSSFTASATRTGSLQWNGALTIDESGVISGGIQALGNSVILPGFQ
jgi:prepilin-type N-terminal cleavage/methylation domain-containing protein